MSATKEWKVEIYIGERQNQTHAEARLVPDPERSDRSSLTGTGSARLNPTDRDVPEIGDELAVARALSDLAHRLVDAAAGDIESITHEHVHLLR